jgi:hypothetical protein
MSWVARALPANSTSTKPASTRATIAGAAPVCTTAGPPTQSTFPPSALTSRICSAIWRSSRDCGFSLDTEELMKPNSSVEWSTTGRTTFTPPAPQTTRCPARTSLTGTVRTRPSSTTRPQSISGCSTGTQVAPSRTTVSRLVVE